jgi:hypothetical protein
VIRKWLTPMIVCLFIGIAGADWLGGGSDNSKAGSWFADSGPDYGDIGSWFGDPIFFSSSTSSLPPGFHERYYPYFGEGFFRGPVQPVKLGVLRSNQAGPGLAAIYPSRPTQSEFRNKSLASMEWPAFKKNWTQTLDLAKKGSSFKVLKDRRWTNMRY